MTNKQFSFQFIIYNSVMSGTINVILISYRDLIEKHIMKYRYFM